MNLYGMDMMKNIIFMMFARFVEVEMRQRLMER